MKKLERMTKIDLLLRHNGVVELLKLENETNSNLRFEASKLTGEYRQQAIDLIKRFGSKLVSYETYSSDTKSTKKQIINAINNQENEVIERIDYMLNYNKILSDIINSSN